MTPAVPVDSHPSAQQVTDCMQPRNLKSRPAPTDVAMRDFVWLSQIVCDSGRKPPWPGTSPNAPQQHTVSGSFGRADLR